MRNPKALQIPGYFTAGKLIRLRLVQIYRSLGAIGLFRALLLVVVLVPLLVLFLVQRVAVYPWSWGIPLVALVIIRVLHTRRKDYLLLQSLLPGVRTFLFAEYGIFSLPLMILMVAASLYLQVIVFLAGLALIAFTKPDSVTVNGKTFRLSMVPKGMFEWQSGIRKNMLPLLVFYLPGLFGFYQLWLSGLSFLVITVVVVSFYSEYEPLNMLCAYEGNSTSFLVAKIFSHAGFFGLMMIPVLIPALISGQYPLIVAGYYLASLNLVTFSILLKYYQYRPAGFSGAHQLLTMLACFISVILPVAFITMIVNVLLAIGARKNLKPYLDVTN